MLGSGVKKKNMFKKYFKYILIVVILLFTYNIVRVYSAYNFFIELKNSSIDFNALKVSNAVDLVEDINSNLKKIDNNLYILNNKIIYI